MKRKKFLAVLVGSAMMMAAAQTTYAASATGDVTIDVASVISVTYNNDNVAPQISGTNISDDLGFDVSANTEQVSVSVVSSPLVNGTESIPCNTSVGKAGTSVTWSGGTTATNTYNNVDECVMTAAPIGVAGSGSVFSETVSANANWTADSSTATGTYTGTVELIAIAIP